MQPTYFFKSVLNQIFCKTWTLFLLCNHLYIFFQFPVLLLIFFFSVVWQEQTSVQSCMRGEKQFRHQLKKLLSGEVGCQLPVRFFSIEASDAACIYSSNLTSHPVLGFSASGMDILALPQFVSHFTVLRLLVAVGALLLRIPPAWQDVCCRACIAWQYLVQEPALRTRW